MQKSVTKNNTKISYAVRSSKRAKKLRITVYCNGAVLITKPFFVSGVHADSLVQKKFQWIVRKINEFRQKPRKILAHFSLKDFHESKQKAYELVNDKIL